MSETIIVCTLPECQTPAGCRRPQCIPVCSAVYAEQPASLSSELDRLREALEEIINPVEFLRRRADAAGSKLDGFMAITLAKDPEYLKGIARAALSPDNSTQKKEG